MSMPTLINFQERRKARLAPEKPNYASSIEMLALLKAFTSIKSPVVRGEIIIAAQDAAGRTPPEDVP
jgi:hypothetical protein